MSLLAETAALLGDAAACTHLYRLLLPWAAFNAVDVAEGIRGSVARYLGLLVTELGLPGDAELHFEEALAQNQQMRARPWLAATQRDYAQMLRWRAVAAATRNVPKACSPSRAPSTLRATGIRAMKRDASEP